MATAHDVNPAGEAFGDPGNGEEVGRTGEQVAARSLVLVHDRFESDDQRVAGPLDLVDHERAPGDRKEGRRVGQRRLQVGGVIQRHVAGAGSLGDDPGQRRFADLAGTVNDHDPERGHGLLDDREGAAGI